MAGSPRMSSWREWDILAKPGPALGADLRARRVDSLPD